MGRSDEYDSRQGKEKPSESISKDRDLSLHDSELRYRRLFESALDGILILNADNGEITDVNPYLIDLLGYSKEEFLGKKLWEIGPLKNVAASKNAFLELQTKLFVKYDDLPLETKDGSHINVEFVSNVYKEGNKKVIQCNIRNITSRKTIENKMVFTSSHDPLTKVYNRTFFDEEIARFENSRQFPISIIMIDVDGLKIVNDTFGHAAGDKLLYRTAQVMIEAFRKEDIIARIGGDEFAVILPITDTKAVKKAIARIKYFLELNNQKNPQVPLQISSGTYTCNGPCSLTQALKIADSRMYQNKKGKRNNSDD